MLEKILFKIRCARNLVLKRNIYFLITYLNVEQYFETSAICFFL